MKKFYHNLEIISIKKLDNKKKGYEERFIKVILKIYKTYLRNKKYNNKNQSIGRINWHKRIQSTKNTLDSTKSNT